MKKCSNAITKCSTKSKIQGMHQVRHTTSFFTTQNFFFKPQINPTAGGFIESSACEKSQCLLA